MRIFLLNLFILIVYVSYAQEEILKTEPVYIISEVSKNKDEKKMIILYTECMLLVFQLEKYTSLLKMVK